MLEVDGLSSRYGRITAVDSVSLSVNDGELVALVGANGAGKSTLLRTLSGVQPAATGNVRFEGVDVTRVSPRARVRMGIVQVPEGRQVFGPLTVEDNLRLGAYVRPATEIAGGLEKVYTLFPILASKRHDAAGTLSGGQQQMLAIAKCLASDPRALLLDEPSQGLAPIILDEIVKVIGQLKARRLPVLLVEQNYGLVERTADRFAVMVGGRIVMTGGKAALADRDRIGRLFLERRRTTSVH